MKITEIKRHLDGREESFICDALLITDDVAILRFELPPGSHYQVDATVPLAGRVTEAVFWRDRAYLLYKMLDDGGGLIGYRFDVCRDVAIEGNTVAWTDLVLDAWVDSDGILQFLDEGEVSVLVKQAVISEADLRIIAEAKEEIAAQFQQIIREAEAVIQKARKGAEGLGREYYG
ncbi:MAG: hypothetical protein HW403_858 [Dehalococcoidia bacterium]|nr:hypothetical protein [Dehalococcoidia bacterium]